MGLHGHMTTGNYIRLWRQISSGLNFVTDEKLLWNITLDTITVFLPAKEFKHGIPITIIFISEKRKAGAFGKQQQQAWLIKGSCGSTCKFSPGKKNMMGNKALIRDLNNEDVFICIKTVLWVKEGLHHTFIYLQLPGQGQRESWEYLGYLGQSWEIPILD